MDVIDPVLCKLCLRETGSHQEMRAQSNWENHTDQGILADESMNVGKRGPYTGVLALTLTLRWLRQVVPTAIFPPSYQDNIYHYLIHGGGGQWNAMFWEEHLEQR